MQTRVTDYISPDFGRNIQSSDSFELVANGYRNIKLSHSGPFFGGRAEIHMPSLASFILLDSSVSFLTSTYDSRYEFLARQVNSDGDEIDLLGRREGLETRNGSSLGFSTGISWRGAAWEGEILGGKNRLEYLLGLEASKYTFYDETGGRRIAFTEGMVLARFGFAVRF